MDVDVDVDRVPGERFGTSMSDDGPPGHVNAFEIKSASVSPPGRGGVPLPPLGAAVALRGAEDRQAESESESESDSASVSMSIGPLYSLVGDEDAGTALSTPREVDYEDDCDDEDENGPTNDDEVLLAAVEDAAEEEAAEEVAAEEADLRPSPIVLLNDIWEFHHNPMYNMPTLDTM